MTGINATFSVAMGTQNGDPLTDLWQSFGRKVRERREELGLTQEAAGKRAKMKRQQWNRIEQGASTKRPTLLRIAIALELDRQIVFDWAGFKLTEESKITEDITIEKFLRYMHFFEQKKLSEKEIETLRPFLQVMDREIDRLKQLKQD